MNDLPDEETSDPLIADHRDFYKVEKWTQDGSKVDLFLHQQGIDTTTPGGKAMFQMLGVFAEFERSIIQERVRAGLRRAKAEGKQLGRPRIAPELETRILAALKAPGRTEGVRKIAKRFGVDPGTVQRISRPFEGGGAAA